MDSVSIIVFNEIMRELVTRISNSLIDNEVSGLFTQRPEFSQCISLEGFLCCPDGRQLYTADNM